MGIIIYNDGFSHYGVSIKDGAPGRGSGRYRLGSGSKEACIAIAKELLSKENVGKIKYSEFKKLQSPEETKSKGKGSCHDQVLYEYDFLKNEGYHPKCDYLVTTDKDGNGDMTHSYVYLECDDGVLYIEHAWVDQKGWKLFDTVDDMRSFVASQHVKMSKNGYDNCYVFDFDPARHKPGEDLGEFTTICVEDEPVFELTAGKS